MTRILIDALRSVALFVPRLLAFAVILAIGYLAARLIRKAIHRGLARAGLDRAIERSTLRTALHRTNLVASEVTARVAYYAVLLFALQLAFRAWGPNPVSDLISSVLAWLPRAAVAIVIVVVATSIAARVRDLIATALTGLSYGRPLARITSIFIIGLGAIAALNQVGIATTVTTPVLITVLATLGGIAVVGLGGGLIRPMQARWETWLDRADQESAAISERAKAYAAGRTDVSSAPVFVAKPTAAAGSSVAPSVAPPVATPVAPAGASSVAPPTEPIAGASKPVKVSAGARARGTGATDSPELPSWVGDDQDHPH